MLHKFVKLFFLSFFVLTLVLVQSTNAQEGCIICAQFIPECKPGEVLVPQTCDKCAHCEPSSSPTSSSGAGSVCETLCGKKCCKSGDVCKVIDRCKKKQKCKKPLIYKCKKSI